MIENGMLVNQTAYDTQCREPKTVRCACCGENVPEYDTEEIMGRVICAFCEDDFCADQFAELGQAYLVKNESEYLLSSCDHDSESLFYNWWLDSLIKTDRLRVLKDAYQKEKAAHGTGYSESLERDFCIDAGDWNKFVKAY